MMPLQNRWETMRLSEALQILHKAPPDPSTPFKTFLASGFTPLHLKTFLAAYLRLALPAHRIEIETGLYGDLFGNLERLRDSGSNCGMVMLEWSDLDARLGLRSLAGWDHSALPEIADHVRSQLDRLRISLGKASQVLSVMMSLPTLPLPPIQYAVPSWNASALYFELQELVSSFGLWIARNTGVKTVSPEWLNRVSPPADRFDVKSELLDGFPYTIRHASAIAEAASRMAVAPPPKKGIITDLDNTFWKGILGDVGPDGVSWDLDQKSHSHALYQSLLRSFAESGVLIAVASKNGAALVEQAFEREDVILGKSHIFPFEVHWSPKSKSITRILEAWNIGPDSVVFVDDSETELAEVKAAHPQVECISFPSDPNGAYRLLERLRDQFAKPVTTEEDKIRLASIRSAGLWREESGGTAAEVSEAFLERAQGVLTLSFDKDLWDPRVLELINKTNQFNLNGRRFTESELRDRLRDPDTILVKASYQDKYGSLGKILVLLGKICDRTLRVESWVLSCRAFSRRIEHACLAELLARFGVETLEFDFTPTDRNKPIQEFFNGLLDGLPAAGIPLTRDRFLARGLRVFHRVEETAHA
jgi:FkbH-like protein